ncbi:hypothetical protein N7486_005511 [Penicillium sp. IBT 16267x]|nr:hypothetical protein N7486_005511 [Penicillium sp. IBT 16267x]
MGGLSTPQEAAPAYEDLYEQRPSNHMTGVSGYDFIADSYSRVPVADENVDIEHQGHEHHIHSSNGTPAIHLATQNEELVHLHCEECDRRQELRERRRSSQNCCAMVSATFVIIIFLLCFFGFRLVAELHKRSIEKNPRDFLGDVRIFND